MDRYPRHLRTAALTLLAVGAMAPECGPVPADDEPPCPEFVEGFRITDPGGAGELLRDRPLHIGWTPANVLASVALDLVRQPGGFRWFAGQAPASAGGFDVTLPAVPPTPFGIYRMSITLGGCAGSTVVDPGATHLVFVQGLSLADGRLDFTGTTPHQVPFTTVSLSSMDVEFYVDPTPDTPIDAGARVFARVTVPGELFESQRNAPFTGETPTGAQIENGTYMVKARVFARDGLTYDIEDGPMLSWVR